MMLPPTESAVRWRRRLRVWLLVLNLALMVAAVVIGATLSRRGLTIALFIPLLFAPFAYARLRLQRLLATALSERALALVTIAGIAFDTVMAAQLLTARSASEAPWLHGSVVAWVGPVWFSAHALAFLGLAVIGLARLVVRLSVQVPRVWRARAGETAATTAPGETPGTTAPGGAVLGRRELLQQFAFAGAAAPFAISLSGVPLSYDFRVEEREIELPGWPRELDGLRVAHLSDIHVGGAMNRARLLRVAELTRAARPDLVLHTGDFLTHRGGDFAAPLFEALATIAVPYGQFACLGNHDYDDAEQFTRRLRAAGVVALRDARTRLVIDGQPLEIAGLDYRFNRDTRADDHRVVLERWRRDGVPRVLLNHDPSAFAALPDGAADLVLSGHTHGGHIGIQLGRDHALTIVGLVGLPDQGIFSRADMRLFVTRCVGFYGYPMRVGIPPEIALLVLRSAARAPRSA